MPIIVTRPPNLPSIQPQGPIYGRNDDKSNPDYPAVSGDNSVGGDGMYGLSPSEGSARAESDVSGSLWAERLSGRRRGRE